MAPLLALGLCGGALGCAQQVGDIDRTQPNKLRKELFEGEWYVRQTIADVPAGNAFYFTGLSTEVEKIRWDINEDMLIGYRSYEFVPGTDQGADARGVGETRVQGCSLLEDEADGLVNLTAAERSKAKADCEFYGEGFTRDEYKGAPLVAYPIVSHFDVQRSYNAATGEQSNVITENTSDRFWYEREYMRLTWHNSLDTITLFDTSTDITYKYPVGEEYEGNEQIRFEYDEQGRLTYMELTQKALVGSSPLCYYINYLELADCAPTEIEVVTSFARVPEVKTYEPVAYENDDMAKFGYFRSERNTYDRQRGLRRTGQIFLPNRHNVWETAYDANGDLIPLKERTPGHVVYYMNYEMPEALESYNKEIEADWDRAFRRTVAAARGVDADAVEQVFVICHNPVRAEDHAACGEEGKVVRVGDVRYNHIYWVDQPQIGGPLGYGPSGTDPETGEIISGTAYVYGASVDTYATSSLDIINLVVTCRQQGQDSQACQDSVEVITGGSDVRADVLSRLDPAIDPRAGLRAQELKEIPAPQALTEMMRPEQLVKFQEAVEDPRPWDSGFAERQMNKMREHGLDMLALDDHMVRDLTRGQYDKVTDLPEDVKEQIRPANWLSAERIKNFEEIRVRHFAENNIMHKDFVDDVVVGLALRLAEEAQDIPADERDEYLYQRLRGLIYRGVMAHEIGHTLGLRHNFQGSYDSLNYFPEYWKLRRENLKAIQFVDDLYEVSEMTPNQAEGRVVGAEGEVEEVLPAGMAEYSYSSIMDYGLQFNTDLRGIGSYDEAAIIYAYTTGYDGQKDPETGRLVKESGYVEVWNDDAFLTELAEDQVDTRDVLLQLDSRSSLAYTHPLEGFHYTNLARGFRSVEDITANRRLVRFDGLKAMRDQDNAARPVEVPYMFCTDDWVGVDSSCHRWDAGADPFEQARYVVDRYREYYWFNNFARDSLEWSASGLINRTYSRYLSYLTNIYQQLFFGRTFDGIQGTYQWMAANAGLNLVEEILMMPNYGEYVYDAEGVLTHCFNATSVEFEEDGVMTSTSAKCGDDKIDFEMPRGMGRYPFTRFDYDGGHEYYYYPTEAGHFYDFLAAVLAMTSNAAVVRDVDVQTDFVSYSLPYYLVFDQALEDMIGAVWMNRAQDFGPVLANGALIHRPLSSVNFGNIDVDPLTGMRVDANNMPVGLGETTVVRPYHSWSQRLYPMLYGMLSFTSNYSLQFVDNNHIFRVGNGEQVNPGEGFEIVTCTDPTLGHTYGATYRPGAVRLSTAYHMVSECQALVDDYNDAVARLQLDRASSLRQSIGDHIERLNMMRGLYNVFGTLF